MFPASGSVVLKTPTAVPLAWFSAIEVADSWMLVGVSLTLVTVIENCCSNHKPP